MTVKSLTPDLQLNRKECIVAGQKAFSNSIQEIDKDNVKPVDLQASATVTAAVIPANSNPLYDESPQHDVRLTSIGQKVLQELNKLTLLETGRSMEFHGIDAREFELIEQILEETGRVAKPRLTYDYETCTLLVDMPSAIHEAPFDCLKLCLGQSIAALPYDRDVVFPMIHMNSSLPVKSKTVTPDICITITPAQGPTRVRFVPFLGESAFTEEKLHAIRKLKKTIAAHPEIKVVTLALIREAQPYSKPEKGSLASATFHKDLTPLELESFITERFPPCTSITIADHNWCHISTVEIFVWVRGDDELVIDIDNEDAEHMAPGTLLPEIDMGAVGVMLNRGVEKIRDSLVTYSKQFDPSVDTTELEEASATFTARWKDYNIAVKNGADITAWNRYMAWHHAVITDALKADLAPVAPTTATSSAVVPDASGSSNSTTTRGRPKRKRQSVSLPPARKIKQV
ncbi:hypothetical protein CY34DRAFT_9991 [Suillus luteus UH-Slu-Lm8-n1]|uniref:Uncharacterized protein n=1 Tax=Suillus luteus UH-Slu-Lm8-n1 TaxID=930992 RepID=A0A0D0B8E2_9AGAM|nr:hypothetical protein CY34DRAFT_9991 [Suillus luteus UH-Slu-Lm8-n1]